jgi:peptidoglycan/xylan/chitin deacetylase (PgdA/CDA1 family)
MTHYTRVIVLFRNDDPSAVSILEHEREIFGLFERYNVPQTLAVVPKVALGDHHDPSAQGHRLLSDNPEMVDFLKNYARRTGSEIALHGLTHRANRFSIPGRREYAEFKYLPLSEQDEMIREGTEILERVFGARPATFVPPWNRWDRNTATACVRNDYRMISAGPYVTPLDGLLSLGCNTDLGSFERDFRRAKASRHRVILNVLFHSITLTAAQKVMLIQALEAVAQDKECEAATIRDMGARCADEVKSVNEAGRNFVEFHQVQGSVRARSWPYVAALGGVARPRSLIRPVARAMELYRDGDYPACRNMTAEIDRACARWMWSGRAAVFLAGLATGWAAGALAGASAAWLFPLTIAPLCLGPLAARKATAPDTRSEMIVAGSLAAMGFALAICLRLVL